MVLMPHITEHLPRCLRELCNQAHPQISHETYKQAREIPSCQLGPDVKIRRDWGGEKTFGCHCFGTGALYHQAAALVAGSKVDIQV